MTTDTIFQGDNTATTGSATSPTKTEDKGLFAALVGDTQKYKTPEELAKAYANADEFIQTLKEENRQLRESQKTAKTIDEVLERLNKPATTTVEDTQPTAQGITPEALSALVDKTLTEKEHARQREANLLKADQLMKAKFGEKAGEVFASKASTPELKKVFMELASNSPEQFVAVFAPSVQPTAAFDNGSVTGLSMPAPNGNRAAIEGTKEWAAKVRKENPTLYWSSEFQYKLQDTAIKNPSLYFGN